MIEKIADRLFNSWRTTLVAIIIFGGITALGFKEVLTWSETIGYYTTAFTLLLVKDPEPSATSKRALRKAAAQLAEERKEVTKPLDKPVP